MAQVTESDAPLISVVSSATMSPAVLPSNPVERLRVFANCEESNELVAAENVNHTIDDVTKDCAYESSLSHRSTREDNSSSNNKTDNDVEQEGMFSGISAPNMIVTTTGGDSEKSSSAATAMEPMIRKLACDDPQMRAKSKAIVESSLQELAEKLKENGLPSISATSPSSSARDSQHLSTTDHLASLLLRHLASSPSRSAAGSIANFAAAGGSDEHLPEAPNMGRRREHATAEDGDADEEPRELLHESRATNPEEESNEITMNTDNNVEDLNENETAVTSGGSVDGGAAQQQQHQQQQKTAAEQLVQLRYAQQQLAAVQLHQQNSRRVIFTTTASTDTTYSASTDSRRASSASTTAASSAAAVAENNIADTNDDVVVVSQSQQQFARPTMAGMESSAYMNSSNLSPVRRHALLSPQLPGDNQSSLTFTSKFSPDSNSTQLLYQHNSRQFQAIKQQLSSFDERLMRLEALLIKLEPHLIALSSSSNATPQNSSTFPISHTLPLPTITTTAFSNTRLSSSASSTSTTANSGLGRLLDAANKNESQFTLDSLMSRASLRNAANNQHLESTLISSANGSGQQHRRYSIQTEPSNISETSRFLAPQQQQQQQTRLPAQNLVNDMLHHTRSVPAFQQQLSLPNNNNNNSNKQLLDMVAAAAAAAAAQNANNFSGQQQNFANDSNNVESDFLNVDESDRLSVDSVLVEDSQIQTEVDEAKRLLKNALQAASDAPAHRIETREVAARVNAVIHEHQISKQILARYLLNGTYKVAYDALHDPREWNYLSAQSREKYRRLKAFSESSDAIQAMKTLELHLKDRLTKRGRKQQQQPQPMLQMTAPSANNTIFSPTAAAPVGMMLGAPQQQAAAQASNNALNALFSNVNNNAGGNANSAIAAEMIARFQQSLANATAANGTSNKNAFQNMANAMLLNSAAAVANKPNNFNASSGRQNNSNNIQQQYQNMASLLQGAAAATSQLTTLPASVSNTGGRKNRNPRRLDQLLTSMSEQMTENNAACGSSSVSASTSGSAGGNESPSSSSSSPQPLTYSAKREENGQPTETNQRSKEDIFQALMQQQRLKQKQEGSSTIHHHPTVTPSASQPQLTVLQNQQQQSLPQQQQLAAFLQRNLLNMNNNANGSNNNSNNNNNNNGSSPNFAFLSRAIQQVQLQQLQQQQQQQQQQAALAARASIFGAHAAAAQAAASSSMTPTMASNPTNSSLHSHPALSSQLSLQHEPHQQQVAAAAAAAAAATAQQQQHAVVAAYHHQQATMSAPTMSAHTGTTVNSSSPNSTTPNNTSNLNGDGTPPINLAGIVPHPALQHHLSNLKSKKLSEHFIASPVALGLSFPDYRKQCLPQVTDEVIRRYEPLDTDQVTRAVRSKLAKGNVSQRLFGEVVLGMSQGAVSDLLKRPKAWEKLTRPTKEHYVRMQMFVEDEDCVRALQAIQNRENPSDSADANSQDSGNGGNCGGIGGASMLNGGVDEAGNMIMSHEPEFLDPVRVQQWREHLTLQYQLCLREARESNGEQPSSINYARERNFFNQVREYFTRVYRAPDLSRSPPIDTQAVATEIREVLRNRNIQQKLIGELVLDVGQGTVSELLNKPKKYEMLSQRGRENYWKLQQLLLNNADFQLLESFRTSVPGRGPPAVSLKRKFSEVGGIGGVLAEGAGSSSEERLVLNVVRSRSPSDGERGERGDDENVDSYNRHYNQPSTEDENVFTNKLRRYSDDDRKEPALHGLVSPNMTAEQQLSFIARLQSSLATSFPTATSGSAGALDLSRRVQPTSTYNNNDDDDEQNGLVIEDDDDNNNHMPTASNNNDGSPRVASSDLNLVKLLASDIMSNTSLRTKRQNNEEEEDDDDRNVDRFSFSRAKNQEEATATEEPDDEPQQQDESEIVVEQEPVSGSWES